jgi:hypothetical protein
MLLSPQPQVPSLQTLAFVVQSPSFAHSHLPSTQTDAFGTSAQAWSLSHSQWPVVSLQTKFSGQESASHETVHAPLSQRASELPHTSTVSPPSMSGIGSSSC